MGIPASPSVSSENVSQVTGYITIRTKMSRKEVQSVSRFQDLSSYLLFVSLACSSDVKEVTSPLACFLGVKKRKPALSILEEDVPGSKKQRTSNKAGRAFLYHI